MRSNISPGLLTNEILLSSMFDVSSPASGRFRALGANVFRANYAGSFDGTADMPYIVLPIVKWCLLISTES